MTIKQFLTKYVDGYLIKDLRSMLRVKLRKGQKIGGVGYPVVTSLAAGIELIGGLMQEESFIPEKGKSYFLNYWDNYLSVYKPEYKPFGNIFYKLVRHGLAHTFLTKPGIFITRNNASNHLRLINDRGNYYFILDIGCLFNDFLNSYLELVKPLIWGKDSKILMVNMMQARVNDLIKIYEQESQYELSKITTPRIFDSLKVEDFLKGSLNSLASGTTVSYSDMPYKDKTEF